MAPDGSSAEDAARCRCGRVVEAAHQYCPSCGRPTDGDDADRPLHPAGDSLLLLGGAAKPSATETTVRSGPAPGLVPRVVGIGLALVGLVLMWGLFRQPSNEVAPEPAKEEAVADTESDDPADGDSADGDSADGEDEAEEVVEEADDDGPTTTARGSTSSDPSGATGPQAAPEPPLAGEETGLVLAISRDGLPALEIVDLDSGQVTELTRQRGRPLGTIDRWLILANESTGALSRLDLDDLDADPIEIAGSRDQYLEVVEITEDRIWVISDGRDDVELIALDIDGQVVEELDFPLTSLFGYGPASLARPSTLFYDPAGGLYRRTGDDGYELVAEGQVLAAGERIAVVRQCDAGLDCQLRWYELRTSSVVGFPAPPPSDGQGFYQLRGGDRWLVYADWRSGRGELIEVATARSARQLSMEGFFGFGLSGVSISNDGRWLVDVVDGSIVIVDLDDDKEWPTGIDGVGAQGIFIEGR